LKKLRTTHEKLLKLHDALGKKHALLKMQVAETRKSNARDIKLLKDDHKDEIRKLKDGHKKYIADVKKDCNHDNDFALEYQKMGEVVRLLFDFVCFHFISPLVLIHRRPDLQNKHADQLKIVTDKLESALFQVKGLAEKNKKLELELSEHVMRAERFDDAEQKHKHEMEKIAEINGGKERLKAIEVDCSQLKKAQSKSDDLAETRRRIQNIYMSRGSGGSSLAASSGSNLGPRVTPTDFSSLIRPTDSAETARMTMLGGIQGSFENVGARHGNVDHVRPSHQLNFQHQYTPVEQHHQLELNKALQAKLAAENELIALKSLLQRPQGQNIQLHCRMTQPAQYVQYPQHRQGGYQPQPQFMQTFGGMSHSGQHQHMESMSDLRQLQQHTRNNANEHYFAEDTSDLTSVRGESYYGPSSQNSMSSSIYYRTQHGEN
jgi:hypothetical protein